MMKQEPISIVDFFSPYNLGHLKEYKILRETGAWPWDGIFIEAILKRHVSVPSEWESMVSEKVADAYIQERFDVSEDVIWQCLGCGATSDQEPFHSLYDCGDVSCEKFVLDFDSKSAKCPVCGKFAKKVSEHGCSDCGIDEMVKGKFIQIWQ